MAPTTFTIEVNGEKVNKGLSWILDKLDWEIPIEAEVRKGSFGAYAHLLAFKLDGELDVGPDDFGQRAQFRFQITPVIRSLIKNPIFDK